MNTKLIGKAKSILTGKKVQGCGKTQLDPEKEIKCECECKTGSAHIPPEKDFVVQKLGIAGVSLMQNIYQTKSISK